jgi:hypothetical protein
MRRAVSLSLCLTTSWALAADGDLGAKLPDGAKKVGEHRYRAPSNYEQTMKHYKSVYGPTYPRKNIINQPGIKAVHIVNPSSKGDWAGINIYESNDEVRIYVVPRSDED